MRRNGTAGKVEMWDLVETPGDRKVILSDSGFDFKRDGKGNITQNKTRPTAKGFLQVTEIDFTDVFAPVSKYATLRLMFALLVHFAWLRFAIDVDNWFSNASLKKDLYVEQLKRFKSARNEFHSYRVKGALYGLRQPSKEWNIFY